MADRTYPLDVPAVLAAFGRTSILGVSGRADGVLPRQANSGAHLLSVIQPIELRHGDCVGWDVAMANRADVLGIRTVAHPPDNPYMRAFHRSTVILPEKPYMDRNTDIANDAEALLAAPPTDDEIRQSGTWATIRRARSAGRPVLILGPTRAWVELPEQPSLEVLR